MTTDTEARLRAALRAGAELITLEPDALPELSAGRRKHWVFWALAAAAAAVVVAVAALSVVAGHNPSSAPRHPSSAPPAHHSSVSTSVPPTTDGLHPAVCRANNAGSWRQTLRDGLVSTSGPLHTAEPLAGVNDRGELVLLDGNEIVLFGPGGHPRTIYAAPSSLQLDVGLFGAGLPEPVSDGNWVVFATEPKRHGSPGLSHIGIVNVQSGEVRMIYNRIGSTTVQPPILVHGVVYWSMSDISSSGWVYSYTIATGERRTLDFGQLTGPLTIAGPFTIGGGVYWDKNHSVVTHVPGVLPPGYVVQAKPSSNAVFVADGTRLAWVRGGEYDAQGNYLYPEIVVRQDGGPSVSVYRSKAGLMPQVVALAGPYLVWQDSVLDNLKLTVLDLRTGATARLVPVGPAAMPAGTPTGRYLVLGLRDGLFSPPTVVDTTQAPQLHC